MFSPLVKIPSLHPLQFLLREHLSQQAPGICVSVPLSRPSCQMQVEARVRSSLVKNWDVPLPTDMTPQINRHVGSREFGIG